jgi:hypothetical protein
MIQIKRDDGFTIIENLVAMSLISFLFILLTHSATTLLLNPTHKYHISARRLAEKALEECLIERAYFDTVLKYEISGKIYVIRRRIMPVNNGIIIDINILYEKSDQIIYTITTKRYHY